MKSKPQKFRIFPPQLVSFEERNQDCSVEEAILHCRSILKATKGVEKEVIPLPSVLDLQIRRSQFLGEYLVCENYEDVDPLDYGWCYKGGHLVPQIQNEEDPLYSLPKEMMTSCSCKGKCHKCKCRKNVKIGQKCARILCKNCDCFRHTKEAEQEDLILSGQFQLLLDEISSAEESDAESEVSVDSDTSVELIDEDSFQ